SFNTDNDCLILDHPDINANRTKSRAMPACLFIRENSQVREVKLAEHLVDHSIELNIGHDRFDSRRISLSGAFPVNPPNSRVEKLILDGLPYDIERLAPYFWTALPRGVRGLRGRRTAGAIKSHRRGRDQNKQENKMFHSIDPQCDSIFLDGLTTIRRQKLANEHPPLASIRALDSPLIEGRPICRVRGYPSTSITHVDDPC